MLNSTAWKKTGWRVIAFAFALSFVGPQAGAQSRNSRLQDGHLMRRIAGRTGADGAREVEDAMDILMAQPTMAPFIARILIWKFATETPSPRYVARVARTFAATGGDIRATIFTLLVDREFWRADVMRRQPKTQIEHFAGVLRALEARTQGKAMVEFGYVTKHLVFYPPGEKSRLLQTDLVLMRDNLKLALLFAGPGNES